MVNDGVTVRGIRAASRPTIRQPAISKQNDRYWYTQNDLMAPEFEWDARKAAENLKNHGVAFDEALTVFADPLAKIFDDPDHSADEPRELIIGHSAQQRLLIVSFTGRGRRTRIIGARQATARERTDYEQNSSKRST
jgi:uncharacterized DUF497 family protein